MSEFAGWREQLASHCTPRDLAFLQMPKRSVVVTGTGAVSPAGNDAPTIHQNLLAGNSFFRPLAGSSIDPNGVLAESGKLYTRNICETGSFDPAKALDGIIPTKDLKRKIPRFAQLSTAATREALNQAELWDESKKKLTEIEPENTAIIVGTGLGGGIEIANAEDEFREYMAGVKKTLLPFLFGILNIISDRGAVIGSEYFKLKGGINTIVGACASGNMAMGTAIQQIEDGRVDVAIGVGTESIMHPLGLILFEAMRALTANVPRPFSPERDGFGWGADAAAAMVFEEEEHAKERGAKILARVAGHATFPDAYNDVDPDPKATALLRAMAVSLLGLRRLPSGLYVVAHGTGTQKNDAVEAMAINTVKPPQSVDLATTSLKDKIGHGLGASGSCNSVEAVQAMQSGQAAPIIRGDIMEVAENIGIVTGEARKIDIEATMSIAAGFGGQNAVMVFEEYSRE